ncbi:MAG: class I SAM-dependent rRNA methyltransferase [Longibaculum muris]|uniref:class I SAM-dependent rRNA methyltransferase n=1 Tax=Longibaculum muris TaxID=1796628 RepID=UPI002E79A508|nr:class I SAM-dependent rRNA methyltransferase [Longibaculum muris]MED9812436.1 class I SAM-dependent rRNA methyltransferase [Longibaculum muris]
MKRNYPKVVISKEGEQWLDKGQMWMYRNNLESMDEDIENGALVDIETRQGRYLGTGFLSKNSHITVRILSKDLNDTFDRKFFKQRIQFAYQFRKTLEADNITNCRLIFGEADQLPGLTVDRYNDILVTQISSYGLEMIKDMIYKLLLEVLSEDGQDVKGIYERNDIKVRSKEGLPLEKGYWKNAQLPTKTVINENGLKLNVDVENGQKTGYFLNQKSNRVLLRNMSHGKRVLDCFSHTGGFALNAAFGNASEVVAVDVSQTALDQGYANAKLNHLEDKITFVKDDVFDYLDKCEEGRFDIIVLDPPAFTKSRRTIDHAYNGYKKINMKAMKLLGRGGYLITCSCSRFMETDNFEKMLRESAHEVGVTLKQVSVTQQNHDYPILWTMEETSYLKFYIFQII